MHAHTHIHTSSFPVLSPGGRVALKHCKPYDSCGHPGVCGLAHLSHSEKALFVWTLSTRRTPLISMTPPSDCCHTSKLLPIVRGGNSGKPKVSGWCRGVMRWCGQGMGTLLGEVPLSTNGIIVWPLQLYTSQMRSELKCGSSEVEQGWNSAQKRQVGNTHWKVLMNKLISNYTEMLSE